MRVRSLSLPLTQAPAYLGQPRRLCLVCTGNREDFSGWQAETTGFSKFSQLTFLRKEKRKKKKKSMTGSSQKGPQALPRAASAGRGFTQNTKQKHF